MVENRAEAIRLRALGLSVPKIAGALGVNPRTVSKWFAAGGVGSQVEADQTIERTFDAVSNAILNRCASAIEKLDAEGASPSRMAHALPALVKVMRQLPRPAVASPADDPDAANLDDLREKVYRALVAAAKEAKQEQEDEPSPLHHLLNRMEDRELISPELIEELGRNLEEAEEEAAPPVPPTPPSAPGAPFASGIRASGSLGVGGNPRLT